MEIFWRLFLSHLIADFTLQTNWINAMKRKSIFGVLIHILVHLVVTTLILLPYLSKEWFRFFGVSLQGYMIVFVICLFHFIVDHLRNYLIKNEIYPDNTLSFVVDQFFHIYFIFIFTPFDGVGLALETNKLIIILSLLVLVSHTSTILIYYIEKDLSGASFPTLDEKYFMIFERVVLFGLMLLEGKVWLFAGLIWLLQIYYIKRRRIVDISKLNLYLSILISVILGFVARFCLYGGV